MVLPVIITNNIGTEESAYFYIDMMMANLIFIIPLATTQSLFAEGSHDEKSISSLMAKSLKIILILLIPTILVTVLFGHIILNAFGKNYSAEGFNFLRILALGAIPLTFNNLLSTVFKIKNQLKEIVVINFVSAVMIIGLSYLFIANGLMGIGAAWIIGQLFNTGLLVIAFRFKKMN